MANSISKEEASWRAESDAETMRRYQEILNDKTRLNAAIKKASAMAKDYEKRASAMKAASTIKTSRSTNTRKK